MKDETETQFNRRKFLRNTTLGAVGATLLNVLPSSQAVAMASESYPDRTAALRHQAEREEFENFSRSFFEAYDSLNLDAFVDYFSDNASQQDATFGDLSVFSGVSSDQCSIHPKSELRRVFTFLFERFRINGGGVSKFIHATGNLKFGGAVDVKAMPNTFLRGGFDLISYLDIRDGKVIRRNDHWDAAQATPEDIAFIHPGGVPRQSCLAGLLPGDTGNAAPEMWHFTRALHAALSSGQVERVMRFFDEDALLVHPLLYRGSGGYGPFNRGIQIRGRKAIARFFRAVLPLLPDGKDSSLIHLVGGATGGGYEWKSGGIYSQQGIARNGIAGATAIDLYNDRIQRMSVKFDTLQMSPEQRDAARRTLATERLVA